MGGNDGEHSALIHTFYKIYRPLQKSCGLRCHMHFDIYGNNLIEIREYEGERKGRYVCRIKEETETDCYRRAIEMLESYSRKGMVRHDKKVG